MSRLLPLFVLFIIILPAQAQDGSGLALDRLEPITASSAARMERAAKLGRGQLLDAFLEADGATLTVISARGIWRYAAADLTAALTFVPFAGDPMDGFYGLSFQPGVTYSAGRNAVTIDLTYRDQVFGGTFDLQTGARVMAEGAGVRVEVRDSSSLRLLDAVSGAPIGSIDVSSVHGSVRSLNSRSIALSPDSTLLALAARLESGSALQIWDVASSTKIAEAALEDGRISRVAFSDDGAQLSVETIDGTAIYRVPDLDLIEQQPYPLYTLSADGRTAAYLDGQTLSLRSLDTGSVHSTALGGLTPNYVSKLIFSPDGVRLYVVTIPFGAIYVVDVASGELLPGVGGFATPIVDFAFSPDSRQIVIAHANPSPFEFAAADPGNGLYRYDLVSGRLAFEHLDAPAYHVALSASGETAYTLTTRWSVHLQDESGAYTYSDAENYDRFKQIEFSPDGTLIAAHGMSSYVLFDQRLRPLARLTGGGPFHGDPIAWDGSTLIAVIGNTIRLLDTPSLTEIGAIDQDKMVRGIAFHSGSRMLAVALGRDFAEGELRLWDLSGAQPLLRSAFSVDGVIEPNALAFNADGSLLAAAFPYLGDFIGEGLVIFDVSTGNPLFSRRDCGAPIAFSPDSRLFACSSLASDVHLYVVGG